MLIVMALPGIFFPIRFNKAVLSFAKNTEMVRAMSMMLFVISFFFLASYRKLDGTWNMLIAILGWLTLLKGVVALRWPGYMLMKTKKIFSNATMTTIVSIICIIVAALLVRVGMVKF